MRLGPVSKTAAVTLTTMVVLLGQAAWATTGWTVTATPNPGPSSSSQWRKLTAVSAGSASDAWAVGRYTGAGVDASPLAAHWNGHAWSASTLPAPTQNTGTLLGVSEVASKDVWAVGVQGSSDKAWVLHYGGTAWRSRSTTGLGSSFFPSGIVALSATNVWLVGDADAGMTPSPAAAHFNGTSWKVTTFAIPSADEGSLNAIARVPGSSTLFAVGYYEGVSPGQTAVAEKYVGGHWSTVKSPKGDDTPFAVTAVSATNIWVAGQASGSTFRQLIEHYDGTRLSVVTSPLTSGGFLSGIASTGAKDVVAVGSVLATHSERTLAEQYTGHGWSVVSSPDPSPGTYGASFQGVTAIPHTTQFWGVGAQGGSSPSQEFTLAARYR